jgi:hypothetical protein
LQRAQDRLIGRIKRDLQRHCCGFYALFRSTTTKSGAGMHSGCALRMIIPLHLRVHATMLRA